LAGADGDASGGFVERQLAERTVQALHDLAILTEGSFEPSVLAKLVAQHTCSLLECASAGVYIWNPESEALDCVYDNSPTRGSLSPYTARGPGVAWTTFRTGKPCIADDYEHCEFAHPGAVKNGVKSCLGAPLLVGSRIIGCINVRSYVSRAWQAFDVELLTLFAAQVSPALQLVQLYHEAERRRAEAELLTEFVRVGASERRRDSVLRLICEQAGRLLRADYAGITLVEGDGKRTRSWPGRWGNLAAEWPVQGRGQGRGPMARAIREARTIVLEHLDEDPKTTPKLHILEGGKSALCTPVRNGESVRGALFVGWRTPISPSLAQVQLAEALAGHAATILDSIESYARERAARTTAEALVRERERIAMDLHDGIIQSLYGVVLILGASRRRSAHSDKTVTVLDQSIAHITAIISDGRDYIHDLRSMTEDHRKLYPAVRRLARSLLTSSRVRLQLNLPHELSLELPAITVEELLYILREALSNAIRHADPSRVSITMSTTGGLLRLTVEDNGCGFDTTLKSTRSSEGLGNMQHRASNLGARLTIDSHPGAGTAVRLELPLPSSS